MSQRDLTGFQSVENGNKKYWFLPGGVLCLLSAYGYFTSHISFYVQFLCIWLFLSNLCFNWAFPRAAGPTVNHQLANNLYEDFVLSKGCKTRGWQVFKEEKFNV